MAVVGAFVPLIQRVDHHIRIAGALAHVLDGDDVRHEVRVLEGADDLSLALERGDHAVSDHLAGGCGGVVHADARVELPAGDLLGRSGHVEGGASDHAVLGLDGELEALALPCPEDGLAVAELALGMMVYMARNFYNGKSGHELKGKKIGVHAYGHVGQNVGRIANGFGMEVYAFDPFMTDEQIKAAGATPLHSAEEMYSMCDYVSLHIPATEQTKKSINYELLSRMPKGAVLVNTARKEIINEEDLVKLMAERPDFKYISDIAPDNAADFAQFEGRYFFTPKKMGAQTEEANINAGLAAARQIVAFLEHGDAKFKVNK